MMVTLFFSCCMMGNGASGDNLSATRLAQQPKFAEARTRAGCIALDIERRRELIGRFVCGCIITRPITHTRQRLQTFGPSHTAEGSKFTSLMPSEPSAMPLHTTYSHQ